ncbi:MAG TPA: SurA N-terminal domain-containing protein [Afifellaceae bacterium]|nr:SurA N-terminal domain-containing protein [Afifellaceae bacterium]
MTVQTRYISAHAFSRLAAAALLTAGLAVALPPTGAPAIAQTSIKVVVNDTPITSYDIDNRYRFLRLTSRGRANKKQAIDQLIDEQLKLQEAKRRNVNVPDSEVDSAFANIARRAKLTPAKLSAALRQQGVNPTTLKSRIRADLAWSRIVRADARGELNVTDQDVLDALGDKSGASTEAEISEFKIQEIIFVIPSKSSKSYIDQRRREAEGFRNRFTSCDSASDLAKGLRDVVVRPTVRRNEQQLQGPAAAVIETPVGKTTRPEKIDEGYQLLAVCGKTTIRGTSQESAKVRNQLLNQQGERFARQKLRDLRSGAMIEFR